MINFLIFNLFLLSLVACGKVNKAERNMDEMNETTGEMNDRMADMNNTTADMNNTTAEMNQRMTDMNNTTANMNQRMGEMNDHIGEMKDQTKNLSDEMTHLGADARQSIALMARLSAKDAMDKATSIEGKFAHCGAYFMAFEFQVWKGTGIDTEERRDELLNSAVAEFFRTFADSVLSHNFELSPLKEDNEMMNLYTVAALLHYVNPNQELFLKNKGLTAMTFEDVLKDIVITHERVNNSDIDMDTLKPWEKEGLKWYDHAVYFLRLRHNFLAAMAVHKLAGFDDLRSESKVSGLLAKGRVMLFPWTAKIDRFQDNPVALDEVRRYIEGSNKARSFLEIHKIQPLTDKTLAKVIRNMQVPSTLPESTNAGAVNIYKKFVATVNQMKDGLN